MHLDISVQRNAVEAQLPATAQLNGIKDVQFNNAELGLRHPIGIYNVSLAAVAAAFQDAFAAAAEYRRDSPDTARSLARTLDNLVDAVTEHFEDVKSIIRIVRNDEGEQTWQKALRQFDATVKGARHFSASQANAIKHKQARIRFVHVTLADAPVFVGYFIDGVDADGAVSPSQDVHRGATAFSLCRAFRYMACSVYFLSRALTTELADRYSQVHGATGFGPFWPVFEHLISFNNYVFWDEPNSCPEIVERSGKITINTAGSRNILLPPAGGRIEGVMGGDGVSNTFRMPYLGPNFGRENRPSRKGKRASR